MSIILSNLKIAPDDCHNYKQFVGQGRCPLTDVCNEDCIFVWKKCYEAMNENYSSKSKSYEDLIDEIESLRDEISSLESDNDELYWKKDEFENDYKTVIEELARVLTNEEFRKLKELNLEGTISDWIDDVEIERSFLRKENKVIDVN